MIVLVKDARLFARYEKQVFDLVDKFVKKLKYEHSAQEIFTLIKRNLMSNQILFYLGFDNNYFLGAYAVIQIGTDIWGKKTAHFLQVYNEIGDIKERYEEIKAQLKTIGIQQVTFTTKRNQEAFEKKLGGLKTIGTIVSQDIQEDNNGAGK